MGGRGEDRLGASRTDGRTPEQQEEIRRIRGEISRLRVERAALAPEVRASRRSEGDLEYRELLARQKGNKRDLFVLQQRLRAVKRGATPGTGAWPDFAIIGAPKCGTTFLYHLLAGHPRVRPAAFKEPHYFSILYENGAEWYRGCFPPPRRRDGRKTITGEASPSYLAHPEAPARMAGLVPQAKLVVLLRNPVDRIYSGYHFFGSRRGWDTSAFGEYAEAALGDPRLRVLAQGIYVDQLSRWSEFYRRDQMLVLKSEDFSEDPRRTLNVVLDFLDLPAWEPGDSQLGKRRNKGTYEQGMDGETRRRLEKFYEPHNRRLYDYLNRDFCW